MDFGAKGARRPSAYIRKHINVHGHYSFQSFQLPELGGGWRELRDPDHADADDD